MNVYRKIMRYFDNVSCEIRMLDLKKCCIFSIIFLILGVMSWFVGGWVDEVRMFFIFPRCAIPLFFAFLLWGVSFCFCGFIFAGVLFGCEKYKRAKTHKIALFIIVMQIFTLCVYPMFFGAVAPLMTFILLLISLLFCFLAIMASIRVYCIWSVCLCVQFLWLLYNSYVSLAFAFVN